MHSVVAHRYGGIDALSYDEVPPPELGPGGVRIEVHAAGVSFANLLAIEGKHQNRHPPPFTPGTEIAGIVRDVSPEAAGRVAPGQRVCAGVRAGGFAEQTIAMAENVFPIPDGLDFDSAIHFPTIYATTYAALAWRARLRPGEVLLVTGAAGASGLAGVELGRALGATVVAVAGGEEKLAVAAAHGAHHGIDHRRDDLRAAVLELTEGRGADVVYDPVGGAVFDAALRCAAPLARLIPIGFASGDIPRVPANIVLVKNLTIIGLYWGHYMGWGRTAIGPEVVAEVDGMFRTLFDLHAGGALTCRIDSVFPLRDFARGLARVRDRAVIGKVVLKPPVSP